MFNKLLSFLDPTIEPVENPSKPWLQRKRFYSLLPYEAYEESSGLFYNKGATGFVLRVHPLVGASLKDQGELAEFFRQNDLLPEGSSLQVLFVASPRVGPLLDYWTHARKEGIYRHLAENRRDFFIKKALGEVPYGVFDYYLLFSVTFPGIISNNPVSKETLMRARTSLENSLKHMGLFTYRLTAKQLLQELSNLLNISGSVQNELAPYSEEDSISKQVLHPHRGFVEKGDGSGVLTQGGKVMCKTYCLKVLLTYGLFT